MPSPFVIPIEPATLPSTRLDRDEQPGAGGGERGSRPRRFPLEGILWLIAAVALWVVGWLKGINLILLLCYVMVVLWVINYAVARSGLRYLTGERVPTGPVYAGEPFRLEVILHRSAPVRPTGIAIEQHGNDFAVGWFIIGWGTAGTLRPRQEIMLQRRGVRRLGPLWAICGFPFGLVRRSTELDGPGELVVLPRCGQVDRRRLADWLRAMTASDGRPHHTRRASSQEADVHGLRPFRAGDSPRWIHWRTTARRGEVMVREFELPRSPDLVVVLDPTLPESTSYHENRLEEAVSLAASVCREWNQEPGVQLGLLILGREPVALEGHGSPELGLRMLEALAREEGVPKPGGWERHFARSWLGKPVMVISTQTDDRVAGSMEARFGRPVARVVPGEELPWYDPPKSSLQSSVASRQQKTAFTED